MLLSVQQVLEHTNPVDPDAWRQLHLLLEPGLGVGNKTSLVAADDIATDRDTSSAVFAGDDRRTISKLNLCNLSQRNRLPGQRMNGDSCNRLR